MKTKKIDRENIKFFQKAKKGKIFENIIKFFIAIILIYNITFTLEHFFTKNNYITIFKFAVVVVNNEYEKGTLEKNDVVILKKSNYNNLTTNSIIGYEKNNEMYFSNIIDKTNNPENGITTYICKWDSNFYIDNKSIAGNSSYWILEKNIGKCGIILKVVQSKIFSVIVLFILIFIYCYNKYLYKQEKMRRKKKLIM